MNDKKRVFYERAYNHFQEEMTNLENGEYQDPLSYDECKKVTVLLSWGGPSDGFKVYFDTEGQAIEGYYFFSDWFEYEQFKLSNEQLDSVLTLYFP